MEQQEKGKAVYPAAYIVTPSAVGVVVPSQPERKLPAVLEKMYK